MVSRRLLLRGAGLAALCGALPRLAVAATPGDSRFVLVILRGAADGLAMAAPYGEPAYRRVRGELSIAPPGREDGLLELDGLFGLHPALPNVHALFRSGELALVHAVASPYRDRSHFDGQDVLENGASAVGLQKTGWLNRALAGFDRRGEAAVALAENTPLVLRGDDLVTSWAPSRLPDAPEDTLRRIARLYENDPFFAKRLKTALETRAIAGDFDGMSGRPGGGEVRGWRDLAEAAARFLTTEDGPRIAVLEAGGWDTHSNQGGATGALANRLAGLDGAVDTLRAGLGAAWRRTVVVIATEFGRTVAVNGTRGTDHGTASAALVLGGAVNGGQIVADWPGIRAQDLYQGRDLFPSGDIRSLFKSVLIDHLGLDEALVERHVFPDSAAQPPFGGLIRA